MTFRAVRRRKRATNDARAHSIGWALRRAASEAGSVYAPASAWLFHLVACAPDDATARDDWPKSPEALSKVFLELTPGLRELGVIIFRSRAMIGGRVHRVWIVESEFNHNCTVKPRPLLLGGKSNSKPLITAHSDTQSAANAENDHQHSEITGAPTMPTKRRKTTVESCRRVRAVEAPHIGAATVETQIGGTAARRLWAVCGECERAVRFLYQLPDGGQWACRTCQNLTTRAQQEKGTRAGFEKWLTPDRWARISAQHPATKQLYHEIGADFRATVAPLDWDKADQVKRLELVRMYATEAGARATHSRALMDWSERTEPRAAQVGEQIRADIWEAWKSLKTKPKN